MTESTTLKDELESLVKSPGWLRFVAFARSQYAGDAYGYRMKQAIATAREKNQSVEQAVVLLDAQGDAVNALLSWPETELKRLATEKEHAALPATMGRGGY